jgi:ammonium transporter, Amt family
LLAAASVSIYAQAPAAAPPAPAPAAVALTSDDVKNVSSPDNATRIKGDPDGGLTGTAVDVTVGDAKKGLTLADLVNQAGRTRLPSTSCGRSSAASS